MIKNNFTNTTTHLRGNNRDFAKQQYSSKASFYAAHNKTTTNAPAKSSADKNISNIHRATSTKLQTQQPRSIAPHASKIHIKISRSKALHRNLRHRSVVNTKI